MSAYDAIYSAVTSDPALAAAASAVGKAAADKINNARKDKDKNDKSKDKKNK